MFRKVLTVAVCLGLPASSYAETWKILGPRPMGMGGAFVAMAEGPLAQYWNPAGLAQEEENSHWGLAIPVGAKAEFTGGVLKDANALGDLASQISAIRTAQKSGTAGALDATKVAAFYQAVTNLSDMSQPGKGALADVDGGANFKISNLAFSVNNFTSVGASPFVDTKNIGLGAGGGNTGVSFAGANTGNPGTAAEQSAAATIAGSFTAATVANLNTLTGGALTAGGITTPAQLGNALVNFAVTNNQTDAQIQQAASQISQNAAAAAPVIAAAASGNSYTNNQSNLTVRGGSFTEIAAGYGHDFFLPGLKVGGNLKLIFGRVGYTRFDVQGNSSGSTDALKKFTNDTASSVRPAIDLGVLWNLDQVLPFLPFSPRAGIVGRNLNNPKFSQPSRATDNGESGLYAENGQIRMGAAISPYHWWNVAMDMDLTDNNTPVPGYHSRMIGLGTEVNVLNRTWIHIPLRAGLMKNVSDASSKLAYTAGFGLNIMHFMLDVGGAVSSDRTQIKSGQDLPSNLSLAIQLGLMF